MPDRNAIAVVIIGRNEGARLLRCLSSVKGAERVVYVDSGSTDGSAAAARTAGTEVLDLDLSRPFTAARARNAGIEALQAGPHFDFVQFVDADCELRPGWLAAGASFLEANPEVAVVSGRLRERFPEASVYNRLCDREWDTPIGHTESCGGIAMMRRVALDEVGGFNPMLIAGEEPELCVRLRLKGWKIWRLDVEMALHDAAMTHFSQWWKRTRRGGHAAAEGMAMHGQTLERHCVAQVRRAILWGGALPLTTVLLTIFASVWALSLLLAYPAQVIRLVRKGYSREEALFLTIGKFPEMLGVAEFWLRRLFGNRTRLIEYK